jgi:hypothetical protein
LLPGLQEERRHRERRSSDQQNWSRGTPHPGDRPDAEDFRSSSEAGIGEPSEIRPETVFIHHFPGDVELRHYLYLVYRINDIKTDFRYLAGSDERLISIILDTFEK